MAEPEQAQGLPTDQQLLESRNWTVNGWPNQPLPAIVAEALSYLTDPATPREPNPDDPFDWMPF